MHGELPALFNKVTDSHSTLTLSTHSHQQSVSSSKSNPPEVRAVQMYNEKGRNQRVSRQAETEETRRN